MRLISRPNSKPYRCAVLPFVGQTHQTARWVKTGSVFGVDNFEEDVYVSDIGLLEVAKVFGFPAPADHRQVRDELATVTAERDLLAERLERLEEELEEERRVTSAIDLLESRDFRARKKAGRPPKQAA